MKMVKNIVIVACAASFMFASVGFHMANNYADLDGAQTVTTSYGATFDLNSTTSVGFDTALGMLMTFNVPAGISLRLGWKGGAVDNTSVGLGFTWWTGGAGLNTSISTNYDYVMQGTDNSTNLSVVVGFGF